jgi:hypothetical protein
VSEDVVIKPAVARPAEDEKVPPLAENAEVVDTLE